MNMIMAGCAPVKSAADHRGILPGPLRRFRTWTFTVKEASCPDMMETIVVQPAGFYNRKGERRPRIQD
jgi:hypothetical protein